MKHFTLKELTRSSTAERLGIRNKPAVCEVAALERLVRYVLDPLRERYGRPVVVTSGYRSPALNRAVGGAATSQHLRGEAADITAGSPKTADSTKSYATICPSTSSSGSRATTRGRSGYTSATARAGCAARSSGSIDN